MSLKIVCDRCGSICPNGDDEIIEAYEFQRKTKYRDNTWSSSGGSYHLCEKCNQDFKAFMSIKEVAE